MSPLLDGACVTEQVAVCEASLGQGLVLAEWVVFTGRTGQGRLEDRGVTLNKEAM